MHYVLVLFLRLVISQLNLRFVWDLVKGLRKLLLLPKYTVKRFFRNVERKMSPLTPVLLFNYSIGVSSIFGARRSLIAHAWEPSHKPRTKTPPNTSNVPWLKSFLSHFLIQIMDHSFSDLFEWVWAPSLKACKICPLIKLLFLWTGWTQSSSIDDVHRHINQQLVWLLLHPSISQYSLTHISRSTMLLVEAYIIL